MRAPLAGSFRPSLAGSISTYDTRERGTNIAVQCGYSVGDRCGGRDNKYGNLAKKRTVSLVLLSSSSYFEGGAELAGDSKKLVFNRQLFEHPSFVEVQ